VSIQSSALPYDTKQDLLQEAINEHQHGIDYEETFSPVVKWGTIRTLVALVACQGWKLFHMEVKTAFLNGDLEVYISQPQVFVHPCQEHLVCCLRKALYGLK
jgi:hypothetical protein